MMIAGALDKAIEAVISAANTLPSVKLIVLDEWCESVENTKTNLS